MKKREESAREEKRERETKGHVLRLSIFIDRVFHTRKRRRERKLHLA